MSTKVTFAVLIAASLVVAGCGSSPSVDSADLNDIVQKVRLENLVGHLQKLEDIATANNGNRAAGTSGYDASVDYVVGLLRDKGFEVQTPEFEFTKFEEKDSSLVGNTETIPMTVATFSRATPEGGVNSRLVAAPQGDSPGCEATDYDSRDVTGAVVLVDRGTCSFAQKQSVAAERGAIALIVVNTEDEELSATLGDPDAVVLPVAGVTKSDGAKLRAESTQVSLKIDAVTEKSRSRNILAQTKTGSATDVVLVGAHLDSVPAGPGINDNGTGVATILETALQLGSEPKIDNAVRFAFWGAEELGLIGSTKYVESLDIEQLKDISLYLNFDMLGSENAGYLTYDGDKSGGQTDSVMVPEGSAGVERILVQGLAELGITAKDTDFDGRSDYGPFIKSGVPAGGIFTGAEEKMTSDEALLWGGKADTAFDANYHSATDNVAHVNRAALDKNADVVAKVIAAYAKTLHGANGVPDREQRVRTVLEPE
ncbi:MAG: M28 family peptidase [Mycobacteriaceae bacterium]